jgi:DNA-binding transcriptional MerR regulator
MVTTKGNIFYTISEIASELKVDKRSIRFCEEKGLISPKVKTLNRRMYSEYDRARLELLLHCEASGYSFDQVVDLIGTPDPDLNKIEQFRKGLEYGEKRLDELTKQSEEMSFHQRTSIMTDINLMRQYVKNLQALKTKILVEYEAKPRRPEEEKVELEPTVAPEPVETVKTEPEEKPMRQPTRMVPVFTAGIILTLMIAGYFYYQKRTKDTKTIDLAQNQTVTMEATPSNQDSVPSAITANQDNVSTGSQELSSSTPLAQQDRLEESKELIDNVPSESQKETKIVLSKADLDTREKPTTQEPIKKEAETTQPVAEQPPEPDTKDKAPDQVTEPETKVATVAAVAAVAAVTEDQPSAPDAVTPAASEETAPKPEAPEPAATQETSVAASTEDTSKLKDHENRIKAFLAYYCRIYETKDLDRFFSLFTADATENDTPFNELRPKYQKNMEIIESFQYRIDMADYSSIPETGNTLVQGNFSIKYRVQGKSWKEHSGNVTMELTEKGDSYLVKRLNYGD